jgi:hypothetical protein
MSKAIRNNSLSKVLTFAHFGAMITQSKASPFETGSNARRSAQIRAVDRDLKEPGLVERVSTADATALRPGRVPL